MPWTDYYEARQGLVAHYPLREALPGGIVPDVSGNGYHGQLAGTHATFDEIGLMQALRIQGNHSGVVLPNVPALNDLPAGSYTISLWYKAVELPGTQGLHSDFALISKNTDFVIRLVSAPRFRARFHQQGPEGNILTQISTPIYSNWERWYHLIQVVDYDAGQVRLYANGQLVSSASFDDTLPPVSTTQPWRIGFRNTSSTNHWSARGWFRDLRIYNRALGSTDITTISHLVPSDMETHHDGIPAWWKLLHFGTLDVDPEADPDEDGISNFGEYILGTDPNSATSNQGQEPPDPPEVDIEPIYLSLPFGVSASQDALDDINESIWLNVSRRRDGTQWTFHIRSPEATVTHGIRRVEDIITDAIPGDVFDFSFHESTQYATRIVLQGNYWFFNRMWGHQLHEDSVIDDSITVLYVTDSPTDGGVFQTSFNEQDQFDSGTIYLAGASLIPHWPGPIEHAFEWTDSQGTFNAVRLRPVEDREHVWIVLNDDNDLGRPIPANPDNEPYPEDRTAHAIPKLSWFDDDAVHVRVLPPAKDFKTGILSLRTSADGDPTPPIRFYYSEDRRQDGILLTDFEIDLENPDPNSQLKPLAEGEEMKLFIEATFSEPDEYPIEVMLVLTVGEEEFTLSQFTLRVLKSHVRSMRFVHHSRVPSRAVNPWINERLKGSTNLVRRDEDYEELNDNIVPITFRRHDTIVIDDGNDPTLDLSEIPTSPNSTLAGVKQAKVAELLSAHQAQAYVTVHVIDAGGVSLADANGNPHGMMVLPYRVGSSVNGNNRVIAHEWLHAFADLPHICEDSNLMVNLDDNSVSCPANTKGYGGRVNLEQKNAFLNNDSSPQ